LKKFVKLGTRRIDSSSSSRCPGKCILVAMINVTLKMLVRITILLFICECSVIFGYDSNESEIDCDFKTANKYSKENNRWEEYLQHINKAARNYVSCKAESCSSCHDNVYTKDLTVFSEGISKDMVRKAGLISRTTKYQIVGGKLYRSQDCMFPFRCEGIQHFLLQLAPFLPDTEFIINTRDWPQLSKYVQEKLPVFSFSKTEEFYDIMYPAWAFWGGGPAIGLYPRGLGRWDVHRDNLTEAARQTPWDSKSNLAFFRGSRTSSERDPLVLLSRKCPKIANARYTKNQAWKSPKDTLGMKPAEEATLESHCNYKYLFNYRGVAASFRLKHLFLCKSLVFHVGSEWLEFFYPALKPWVHYIPVPSNASEQEIFHLLEFVMEHQDIAQDIALAGAKFVEEQLKMEDVTCYWDKLIRAYTNLLQYKVERDPTLTLIGP